MYDTLGATGNNRFEEPIQVLAGESFILLVTNFRRDTVGYQILFDNPATYPGSVDVTPPRVNLTLDSVVQVPNCLNDTLVFGFNNSVFCDELSAASFSVVNLANPSQRYDINYFAGDNQDCANGPNQFFRILFSPIQPNDNYAIILNEPVRDICGDTLATDTLPFKVKPFVQLQGFRQENLQDTVCSGVRLDLRAVIDSSVGGRISTDYRFQFYQARSSSYAILDSLKPGSLPAGTTLDSNQVGITQSYPQTQFLYYTVFAENPLNGCSSRDSVVIRVDPLPVAPLTTTDGICFGESFNLSAGSPADSAKYLYTWRTTPVTTGVRIPRRADFNVIADTVNRIEPATTDNAPVVIHRGSNVKYFVRVKFKPTLGGCELPEQQSEVRVGAYIEAAFDYDSIIRPGREAENWMLPVARLRDRTRFRSINPGRTTVRQAWLWGDNTVSLTNGPIDTINHIYSFETATNTNSYTIRLDVNDTLLNNKVCRYSDVHETSVVKPTKPNLITRNGDGVNDYFEVPDLIPGYELVIVSRWGREVYRTDNYDNRFSGADLAPGIYFYQLQRGGSPTFKGWVEITDTKQ